MGSYCVEKPLNIPVGRVFSHWGEGGIYYGMILELSPACFTFGEMAFLTSGLALVSFREQRPSFMRDPLGTLTVSHIYRHRQERYAAVHIDLGNENLQLMQHVSICESDSEDPRRIALRSWALTSLQGATHVSSPPGAYRKWDIDENALTEQGCLVRVKQRGIEYFFVQMEKLWKKTKRNL